MFVPKLRTVDFAEQVKNFQALLETGKINEKQFKLLVGSIASDVTDANTEGEFSLQPGGEHPVFRPSIQAVRVSLEFRRRRLLLPVLILAFLASVLGVVGFGLTGFTTDGYGIKTDCDGAFFELNREKVLPPSDNPFDQEFRRLNGPIVRNRCHEPALSRLRTMTVILVGAAVLVGLAAFHDKRRFGIIRLGV